MTTHDPSFPAQAVYDALFDRWGSQHWWPGRTRMEIIVGAILTQNTAWRNVEKAILRLKKEKTLTPAALNKVPEEQLAAWIKPSGYFNVKARRLKAFINRLYQPPFDGSLRKMFAMKTQALRGLLLDVKGIGPETADSILLYAGGHLTFVVDAYTRRFLVRHGWLKEPATYDEVAQKMTRSIPPDVQLYNEYHALIVLLAKTHCHASRPECDECPLHKWC